MIPKAPPRILSAAALGVVLACVLMTFVGGWGTGISWDETFHVQRLGSYLDHGWYVLPWDLEGGEPEPGHKASHVYAPVTALLAHGVAILWGTDTASTVGTTPEAFAVRHLVVSALSVVGLAATAVTARIALRSWQWGAIAAAVLVATPMWTGHAMWNIKDVPVAAGYAVVTLGLVLLVRSRQGDRTPYVGAAVLFAGAVLMVGTRPGMWAGLAASSGIALLLLWFGGRRRRIPLLVGSLVAVYLALWAIYPQAFGNPVDLLWGSATESADFNETEGHWWWIPANVFTEVPWLLLAASVPGVAVLQREVRERTELGEVGALLATQALVLPIVAIVMDSNVYTGLRQFLFVAPAMAVVAAIGLAHVTGLDRWWRLGPRALLAFAVATVVLPTLDQARLFPYNYAWAAPVPDAVGLGFTTDYWRTSVRALAPSIPADATVVCGPELQDDHTVNPDEVKARNCPADGIGPLRPYREEMAGEWSGIADHFIIVVSGEQFLPDNCAVLDAVDRWAHFRRQRMGYVAECWPADG
ncbi:hypothetical protein [Nocardioides stalactiti]|uniref:hypothetical protein n=1 Tax=Nocardioides stalactiti TaxID=2755356 RepID=UPI001603871D|nr:hypothetical protein [Nocardioides stalactiti]